MTILSWEDAGLRPLSDEQWAAVRAAHEGHVLVSAGAGSGKTHTVIAAIAWHLGVPIRGEVCPVVLQLRDLGAITFTNRAAADLKGKLRRTLSAVGLKDYAYDLDLARIGTIHGFCGEILREFALRVGAPPIRTVLDENEGNALRADAVRDVLLQAAEANDLPGLQELFLECDAEKVQVWIGKLAAESDRVAGLAARLGEMGPREGALVTLASRAVDEFARRLGAERAVDFDRMIVRTRDIVRDHADVRTALQRRIKLLIVDEFQDVDPVQQDVARRLGGSAGDIDRTRLMLVGDAKQSIYRFRRADVTGWKDVEREFAGGRGRTVPLSTNYRSTDGILAFVQASVGTLLDRPIAGAELADYEIPFAPLSPDPERAHEDRSVEAIVIPECDDGKAQSADHCRQLEADAVARRILELHAEGSSWKDVAIVLASWSDMDHYENALRRSGIPSYALRLTGFYDRREVVDCLLALRVLRDPSDDVAFMGWLRSPFVGVRDDTLLRISRDCAQPYVEHVGACVIPDAAELALVSRGMEMIRRHSALRDRIPTSELLLGLLEESGYLAHLALMGTDGLQSHANIRKLLRELGEMRDSGVADVLRTIDEAREQDVMVGDERLYGELDDVVTITSIHSAKGLEWPIVAWCDLYRSLRPDYDKLKVNRDRIELGLADEKPDGQSAEWQALCTEIENETIAEQKRLWYVAATRAGERLVLSGIPQGKPKTTRGTPALELLSLFPEHAQFGVSEFSYQGLGKTFTLRVTAAERKITEHEMPDVALVSPDALPAPHMLVTVPAGRGRHSATELMLHERCQRKHWFKYIAGVPEPAVEGRGRRKDELISALAKGQIVHDVLEKLAEEYEIEELLEEAIGRWDPDAPLPDQPRGREYRALLRHDVELIANDPTYRSVADLPGARRELEFVAVAPTGAVMQGAFDLAGRDSAAGKYVLLDVKMGGSGGRSIEERVLGYTRQMQTYVSATEAISDSPVDRFVFAFGAESKADVREIRVDGGVREAMIDQLGAAVDLLPRGGQELATDAKTCRSCGYRRVGWCAGVESSASNPAESMIATE